MASTDLVPGPVTMDGGRARRTQLQAAASAGLAATLDQELAGRNVQARSGRRAREVLLWTVTLLAAGLPQVAFDVLGASSPAWLGSATLAILGAAVASSVVVPSLRALTRFFLVLVVMQPALQPSLWPAAWRGWSAFLLPGQPPLRAEFVLELCVAVAMAALLIATGLPRRQAYLALGDRDAIAAPVRGLFDRPIRWSRLAPASGLLIGLGTLMFLLLAGAAPSPDRIVDVFPTVLLFAAMNALNEEVTFRAGPMASLSGVVGPGERLALVVVVFAVPHYFGIPSGLVGVAMSALLAAWLAKCLGETRGLLWPWVIHVVQDVLIFSFVVTSAIG